MHRLNTRTAAAATTAVFLVFLLSGCPGKGTVGGNRVDPNLDPSEPNMTEERTVPEAKKIPYAGMSEEDKVKFVHDRTVEILKELGTTRVESLSDEAVANIKKWVDIYSSREGISHKDDCSSQGWVRSDLTSVVERGRAIAPQINRAFADAGLAPQAGLYIAMIESEFCPCLQSPTGPLGMFQLTTLEGRNFGLNTKAGSTPSNPDDRCALGLASVAAAKRLRAHIDRLVEESSKGTFGKKAGGLDKNSANTVLLAIAANNMGIESFVKALQELGPDASTDIWSLIENQEKLPEPFRMESAKYVPKFFAAAIVGENASNFGMTIWSPLSGRK